MLCRAWMASHLTFRIFPYLATQDDVVDDVVNTYSCRCPQCRFTSPTPTYPAPLCTSLLIISFAVLPRHAHTARCLSAAYPGIQQTILISLLILPLHPPSFPVGSP